MEVFYGILILILAAFIVATLGSRLMGIRLGAWRGLLAGAIGYFIGVVAAAYTLGKGTGEGQTLELHGFYEWVAALAVIAFFGVLAMMPVAITIDLLTRRGGPRRRRRRRWILHPIRAIKAVFAPYGRFAEVVGNARRAGLLHFRYASQSALATPELAQRVRRVLEDSGGILVKFGQIASTRSDILPEELTSELASLRADALPVSEEGIREVIEAELGEPAEQAFASFDWEPLAAASIGQTHTAVLADGTPVVVKVRRPGVEDVVDRDAAALRLVARRLVKRSEAANALGLTELAEELIAGVREELDYRHEADVSMRLRENRKDDVGIAVPKIYPTLSTDRVLVMEQVIGRSIGDDAAITESPVPRPELARRVLSSFLGQILDDGMYHADPHPGNLLIDASGSIWLIDLGSVGRLDSKALESLREIALGVATKDTYVIARATREMAATGALVDIRALEAELSIQLADLGGLAGIDPQMIMGVLDVMQRFELRPPPSMTLLGRALITLDGTLHGVEPGFNFAQSSLEIVKEEHRDAFGTPAEIIRNEALRQLPSLRSLPEHAETIANQLRAGRLTVRTERFAGPDRGIVEAWVDRVVVSVVGGALALFSALLLLAAAATDNDGVQKALWILGFAAGALATILLMRSAAQALRRQLGKID
jgi:ubiquinone biosynthesis protein